MIPQNILIALMTFGLGCAIRNHGKPRDPENAMIAFLGWLVQLVLLVWGGFFDCWLK